MLFVATEEAGRPDPVPAWQAVCADLTVHPMTADHFTVMDHVEEIVDRVTQWLADRDERPAATAGCA
jgi:thioesterase domain-containing protein